MELAEQFIKVMVATILILVIVAVAITKSHQRRLLKVNFVMAEQLFIGNVAMEHVDQYHSLTVATIQTLAVVATSRLDQD